MPFRDVGSILKTRYGETFLCQKKSLSRANAIVALEGYVPTEFDRKLDKGLISGRLTTDQAIALISKRARELLKGKAASKQNA
jgi:hypothetical protein